MVLLQPLLSAALRTRPLGNRVVADGSPLHAAAALRDEKTISTHFDLQDVPMSVTSGGKQHPVAPHAAHNLTQHETDVDLHEVPVYVPSGDKRHPIAQHSVAHNFSRQEADAVIYSQKHGLAPQGLYPCAENWTVFDLGFYDGADSKSYLEGGFCVVGVEADPDLVQEAVGGFAVWMATGQLRMANIAVAPSQHSEEWSTFYRNKCTREWNSFYDTVGCRSCEPPHLVDRRACDEVPIRAIPCAQIFYEFGVPHYLKLDIEGAEPGCFEALSNLTQLNLQPPQFISAEITQLTYLDALHGLGYQAFKLVRQDRLRSSTSTQTGPWGHNALDCRTGTLWRTYAEAYAEMQGILTKTWDSVDPCPGGVCSIHDQNCKGNLGMWYDVHVALVAPEVSR